MAPSSSVGRFDALTMEELSYDRLPVIAVSAKDHAAASSIISEIIDNEFTEAYKGNDDSVKRDRVWRIVNKYYTADVRLHPVADDEESSEVKSAEAHVIYLTEEEGADAAGPETVQRRAAAAARADTRLVLVAGGGALGLALPAAAARARAELVQLAAPADHDDDDDERGLARVRSALHAHLWTGRRAPAAAGEDEDEDDEQRAEMFFAALAALPAAGDQARAEADDRETRLARAEALVAAFCRALGHRLDDC